VAKTNTRIWRARRAAIRNRSDFGAATHVNGSERNSGGSLLQLRTNGPTALTRSTPRGFGRATKCRSHRRRPCRQQGRGRARTHPNRQWQVRVRPVGGHRVEVVMLDGRDVAEARPDADTAPRRDGVLEADPELADDLLGAGELSRGSRFWVRCSYRTPRSNRGCASGRRRPWRSRARPCRPGPLIQGLRDQLADRVGDGPVL